MVEDEVKMTRVVEEKVTKTRMVEDEVKKTIEGWVAKSVARQLATAALWVQIQTSFKNHKWATYAKEWPTHSSPPKKYTKKKKEDQDGGG